MGGASILMGFAEAVPAPEAFFSLHAAGHRVRVFTRAGAAPALLRHLPVGVPVVLPPPERDAAGAVAALRAALAGEGAPGGAVGGAPDAVLALDDVALRLLDAALGPGGDRGGPAVRVANVLGAGARLALDKSLQIRAAAEAGFAVPPTEIVEDAAGLRASRILPAIVKPALAVQEAGGRYAKGEARYLADAAARAAAADDPGGLRFPALVQPLIAGTGEGVFGFATAGGVTAWSGHRRLRMMNPHGSGASACIGQVPEPALREAAAAFVAAAGWRGPFMIELLRDAAGKAWFMELNGRLWGSLALARRAGLEYPAWAVAQALDPGFVPPPVALPRDPLVLRHLGRDLLHLLFVLRGPKTAFHAAGWPRFWPALRAVLAPAPGRAFYNHDPAFPRFYLREAAGTVLGMLGRRR